MSFDYQALDAGIRDTVRFFREELNLETTDSGDGTLYMAGAINVPHVVVYLGTGLNTSGPPGVTADRVWRAMKTATAGEYPNYRPVDVSNARAEVTYSPSDRVWVLLISGFVLKYEEDLVVVSGRFDREDTP